VKEYKVVCLSCRTNRETASFVCARDVTIPLYPFVLTSTLLPLLASSHIVTPLDEVLHWRVVERHAVTCCTLMYPWLYYCTQGRINGSRDVLMYPGIYLEHSWGSA
jgi:hypothetical protein